MAPSVAAERVISFMRVAPCYRPDGMGAKLSSHRKLSDNICNVIGLRRNIPELAIVAARATGEALAGR
jgi:hypothetical protein